MTEDSLHDTDSGMEHTLPLGSQRRNEHITEHTMLLCVVYGQNRNWSRWRTAMAVSSESIITASMHESSKCDRGGLWTRILAHISIRVSIRIRPSTRWRPLWSTSSPMLAWPCIGYAGRTAQRSANYICNDDCFTVFPVCVMRAVYAVIFPSNCIP